MRPTLLLEGVEFLRAAARAGRCACIAASSVRSWPYQRNTRERMRNSYSGGTMRDSGSRMAMMMPSASHMRSTRLASQNGR